jgi:hypothetical protein
MLCPRCFGTHILLDVSQLVPCPDCGGWGEIHCCDGLTEQPEIESDATIGRRSPPTSRTQSRNWTCEVNFSPG